MSRTLRFAYSLAIIVALVLIFFAWTAIPDCPDVPGMCAR